MNFDSVQIGVRDLDGGVRTYETLLDIAPTPLARGGWRFQLTRGAVELEPGDDGIRSIGFTRSAEDDPSVPLDAFHGLRVRIDSPAPLSIAAANDAGIVAIDHVVIHTPDIDRAIALWRDRCGLRLALDREFSTRGLRMAFFRSGGVTLEYVSTLGAPAEPNAPDGFYGLAYRVGRLESCRSRLLAAGFDLSLIRPGQKRGTVVATVRSGTAGVPTLLIEHSE